jgi:hypothetical protein
MNTERNDIFVAKTALELVECKLRPGILFQFLVSAATSLSQTNGKVPTYLLSTGKKIKSRTWLGNKSFIFESANKLSLNQSS